MSKSIFIRRWLRQSQSYICQGDMSEISSTTSTTPRVQPKGALKRWCITLNNYTEDEYTKFQKYITDYCTYGIIGKELSESGTPHLQAYISLKKRMRLTTLKNSLLYRAHYIHAKGSPGQNQQYCSKEGNFWENGKIPKYGNGKAQGSFDEACTSFIETVESGSSVKEYMYDYPKAWLLHGQKFLSNFYASASETLRPNFYAIWIWGDTGIGKSHFAFNTFPGAYRKIPNIKWWTGYRLERQVVVDEINVDTVDISYWLTWCDKWKISVEVKGGHIPLLADEFIFTSNQSPEAVFMGKCIDLSPLLRRLKVFHVKTREDLNEVSDYILLQQTVRDMNESIGESLPELSSDDLSLLNADDH